MKLWPLLGSLILILATLPAYSADEPPAGAGENPPPFTLEAAPDDPPEALRFKAALRLLKSAQGTTLALKGCGGSGEAEKALKTFSARNGNTLAQAMGVIRSAGGFGKEIKEVVEREALLESTELSRSAACGALAARILDGERDLYKAPQLAEDYRLMRERR